ncbi:MAG: phage tail tape measure protein [Prevotella sp.]
MRKVQAVTESTGEQFDALTDQAKLLGATTSYTAQDAAEAMTYLGQAGFNSTQIIAAMPATLNLARASMTELGTTADIMSNIMNGFQIGAEDTARASDVLSKAANATNTDVTGLGEAMKYAAPLAHQMSWSLEETAAAAGMLSNAGIKADMAGTVLRNAITRLIAPTDKTVTLLNKYGVTIDMVNPKVYSLAQILDTLTAAGISSGDMMSIFGMRAGPGMMALVNQGTASLKNMEQELINAGGYAQKAADEMDAGWGGVVRLLGDTVEALQLSFGNAIASILTPFAEVIAKIGYVVSQLPSPFIYAASAVALLSVAAGTLLVSLSALPTIVTILNTGMGVFTIGVVKLATGIASLSVSGGILGTLFTGITSAITLLSANIALIITGITALGIAFYELEQRTHVFSGAWETLQDLFTIGSYYAGQALEGLRDVVSDVVDGILDKLNELGNATGINKFVDVITSAYDKISGALGTTKDNIHETAESIRSEEEKQAESASNVQKQIESAHSGIISSYQTVDAETGQTYSSMIENADSMSDGVTSANSDIISSNSDLISSNNAVSESSPTIKYTLDRTDIDSIANPTKGAANLTADALNNGIELADGSMLKFNESGQVVIETLDGIQKRLYDIGNTSVDLSNGDKVWTITDNYTESDGKLINNAPTRKVSLAEAGAAADEEDKYLNSPEATAAKWQKLHPNDTVLYMNSGGEVGNPDVRDLTDNEKSKLSQWDKPLTEMPATTKTISLEDAKKASGGKAALSTEYLEALKKQQALESPISSISKGGILDKIKAAFSIPKTNKPTQYDINKEQIANFDWSKLLFGSSDKSNVSSASFAPNFDGIIEKYNSVKEKMQEINSFKFDGIKSSISEISKAFDGISFENVKSSIQEITDKFLDSASKIPGVQSAYNTLNSVSLDGIKTAIQGIEDKFSDSVSKIPGVQSVLSSLNSISYDGLKSSIQGYIDKFSDSVSQIPGVQSVLEGLNGISYEGLKSSIQGYMTKFGESISQNPLVKSTLESLNSISYEGLKSTIQGYMSKFQESVSQNPLVKSTLESLNSISYESLKSTIQGYMTKFGDSAAQIPGVKGILESLNSISYESLKSTIQGYMTKFSDSASRIPGVKSTLETLNSISYESLKSTIQGVINKFGDTISTIPGVKSAIGSINNISFSGILSSIGKVSEALSGLISAAKSMYEKVSNYVSSALNEKSKSSNNNSSVTNKTSNTTTNNNITIKTYATASNVTQWVKKVTGG